MSDTKYIEESLRRSCAAVEPRGGGFEHRMAAGAWTRLRARRTRRAIVTAVASAGAVALVAGVLATRDGAEIDAVSEALPSARLAEHQLINRDNPAPTRRETPTHSPAGAPGDEDIDVDIAPDVDAVPAPVPVPDVPPTKDALDVVGLDGVPVPSLFIQADDIEDLADLQVFIPDIDVDVDVDLEMVEVEAELAAVEAALAAIDGIDIDVGVGRITVKGKRGRERARERARAMGQRAREQAERAREMARKHRELAKEQRKMAKEQRKLARKQRHRALEMYQRYGGGWGVQVFGDDEDGDGVTFGFDFDGDVDMDFDMDHDCDCDREDDEDHEHSSGPHRFHFDGSGVRGHIDSEDLEEHRRELEEHRRELQRERDRLRAERDRLRAERDRARAHRRAPRAPTPPTPPTPRAMPAPPAPPAAPTPPSAVAPVAPDHDEAMLLIHTAPPAEVYVDGERVGMTPQRIRVAPGAHEVTLVGPDGTRSTNRVVVAPGATSRILRQYDDGHAQRVAPDRKAPTGRVHVRAESRADVFIDGRPVGATPLVLDLAPGNYTIGIVNRDTGETDEQRIGLSAGDDLELEYEED